jgi:hypothetical protein
MPDILAEIKGMWLDGRQTEFLQAVHRAVVHALKTPDDEPLARLIEHQNASLESRSFCSRVVRSKRSDSCTKPSLISFVRSTYPPTISRSF